MANGRSLRSSPIRWGAVAILVAAGLGVGTLVAAAYDHATPDASPGAAAPIPTFTLGVVTPTPTPTPTPEPIDASPRDTERFLTVGTGAGADVWWRGVSGECGGAAPLIERSTDAGITWVDVTPLYRGVTQLASLDAFAQTEAEIVVGVGATCEPQAMRTFTQGQFWEPYPDVLAASRFVGLNDTATVQLPSGAVDAPCGDARGLRAAGETVVLVCDGVAFVSRAGAEWVALPAADAAAVATDGTDVLVAHRSDACPALTLTRFTGASPGAPTCVDGDPTQPIALALTPAGPIIWSAATPPVIE